MLTDDRGELVVLRADIVRCRGECCTAMPHSVAGLKLSLSPADPEGIPAGLLRAVRAPGPRGRAYAMACAPVTMGIDHAR